jgi:hypothetical protein
MNQNEIDYSEFTAYIRSLKGKSWAEICWEAEEREEEEARIAHQKKLKAEDEERKQLFLAGKYELEDGEVFE